MVDKIKRGKEGENLAANFLKAAGYQIIDRNYRYRRSEIDLIATKDKVLVFVEVKTRGSHAFGYPEEFVDEKKAEKVLEGAEQYMIEKDWQGDVRYDIISISMIGGETEIKHFRDAFH
ncbi:MAG: YraN family protein [Cyclobacteriaceae bacterium]